MGGFASDLFSIARSRGLILLCGLLKGVVIARWLGPEGVGVLAALVVYPTLFISIGSLGLQQATTYFLGQGVHSEEELQKAIIQTWVLSSSLSVAVCIALVRYLTTVGTTPQLVLLAVLPIPFALYNKYSSGIFLGKNDIVGYNRINWIPAVVALAVTVVAVVWLDGGIAGALVALLAGPMVMAGILAIRQSALQTIDATIDWNLVKNLLGLGSVYAVALAIVNLNYRLDVVLLDYMSTESELGIYSRAGELTEYLWQIPMLLSTIIFARSASAADPEAFSQKVHALLRISLIAISLAALMIGIFADSIVVGLYGVVFGDAADVMRVLVPGVIALTAFKVLNMDLAGRGRPWVAIWAMLPALLINVAANVMLIPTMGARGAAVASTVSYTFAGLLFLHLYARAIHGDAWQILRFRIADLQALRAVLLRGSSKVSA